MALALVASGRLAMAAESDPPKKATKYEADDRAAAELFSGPVRRFVIQFAATNLQALRNEPRVSVPATVIIDGTNRFENVAIHVKGSAGSTRSIDDNPAMTLNFDKLVPGRKFSGMDKIHLNNSVQDPSLMAEQLAARLYRELGIPTARASQAIVTLEGRELGLYVLKEGYNRTFLRRNFPDPSGNLYDGGFVRDIDQDLERDAGDGPEDRKDLQKLRDATAIGDLTKRQAAFSAILDVDRFITECAMQSILCDWDGYGYNRNNYRLYHQPKTGKFVFIPHGMDQLLGDIGRGVETPGGGMLARQFYEIADYRDRFYSEVERLIASVFVPNILTNHFKEAETRLLAAIETLPKDERGWRINAMRGFQSQAFGRIDVVKRHLATRPKPIRFDANGVTALAHWQPRYQRGQARIEAVKLDEVDTLHITAQARETVSSFRATIRLPIGKYVVNGRIKTRGVVAADDQRYAGGAGMRLSGGEHAVRFTGDNDWKDFTYEFQVHDPHNVELVAELRAHQGDVWFDLNSLKLQKR